MNQRRAIRGAARAIQRRAEKVQNYHEQRLHFGTVTSRSPFEVEVTDAGINLGGDDLIGTSALLKSGAQEGDTLVVGEVGTDWVAFDSLEEGDLNGGGGGGAVDSVNGQTGTVVLDADDVGAVPTSLIDAKGDLLVGTAADTVGRLPVGTDGFFLTADSSEPSGLKWVTAPGGGGGTYTAGDGLSESPANTFNVDSTVARRNATNTFASTQSIDTGAFSAEGNLLRLYYGTGGRTLDFKQPATDTASSAFVINTGNALEFRIDNTAVLNLNENGNLVVNNKILSGVADPTLGTHVGDRDYNDARYASVSSGTSYTFKDIFDTTNTTDEATKLQNLLNTCAAAGGGVVELPYMNYLGGAGIKIGSLVTVPQAVVLRGQGKEATGLRLSAASAGIRFVDWSTGNRRQGRSGGFTIHGGDVATTPLLIRSVNANYEDIKVVRAAANGTTCLVETAQNNNWWGLELDNQQHTAGVKGLVLDLGASGNNFWGTQINEMRGGHVIIDQSAASPSPVGANQPTHNSFFGIMWERSDSIQPLVHIKAGRDISFKHGNFSSSYPTPYSEYDAVLIDSSAAHGSAITLGINFEDIIIGGTLGPTVVSATLSGDQNISSGTLTVNSTTGYSSPSGTISIDGHTINYSGTTGSTFTGCTGGPSIVYPSGTIVGQGTTGRWANAFRINTTTGVNASHVRVANCQFLNCRYAYRLDNGHMLYDDGSNIYRTGAPGTASSIDVYNPAGSGRPNWRSIASASNLSNVTPYIDYYYVTGTTNISTIPITKPNHRITLEFASTLTINHGTGTGNPRMQGSTNLTTEAGAIVEFVCNGVEWRERFRNLPSTGPGGGGGGDMLRSTYDPDLDGIIAIAQGGTGASSASGARTALDVPQTSAAMLKSTYDPDTDGIIAVAQGGTGASTAGGARSALSAAGTSDANIFTGSVQTFERAGSTDIAFRARIAGDSIGRFRVQAGGALQFGGDGATIDTRLYRTAAATLTLDNNAGGAGNLSTTGRITSVNNDSWSATTLVGPNVDPFHPVIGAVADGATDNTTAFGLAHAFAAGRRIRLQPGTYALSGSGVALNTSSVIWSGSGMHQTTLKALSGATNGFFTASSAEKVVFEDLTFDGNEQYTTMMPLSGTFARHITFRRCRFTGFQAGIALTANRFAFLEIEDCIFDSPGTGNGTAVSCVGGATHLKVKGCRFLWLNNGVVLDAGASAGDDEELIDRVILEDNYCEGGWYLLREQFAGEGGTVSYSNPAGDQVQITDSGASFSGITSSPITNVRIMPVRQSGTINAQDNMELEDTSASFISNGVRRGDIVYTSTKMAVVSGVESATKLRVEEWWDRTTRAPVAPPAASTAYTAYGVLVGRVTASTGTTVTLDMLYGFNGVKVAAGSVAAGTRYEVMYDRPNYSFTNAEKGVRSIRVLANTVKRSWSDGIAINDARFCTVAHNLVEDCQDMGITTQSTGSRQCNVHDNVCNHNGIGGIWLAGDDSICHDNIITDSHWQRSNLATDGADIYLIGDRNDVHNNHCERLDSGMTTALYGISVRSGADDNQLSHNRCRGHATSGINIASGATNTQLRDNKATVTNSGTATDLGQLRLGIIAPQSSSGLGQTTAALTTSNRAYLARFTVDGDVTVSQISFNVTTAATNDDACDVGIYSAAYGRLVSAGATTGKLNVTGVQTVTFTPTTLLAGQIYYAAFSIGTIGGTGPTLSCTSIANTGYADLLGSTAGLRQQSFQGTAHPLPSTHTSGGALNAVPYMAVK